MRTSVITNKEEIDKIISKCDVCFVGMVDGEIPYVIPMNFGYDGEDLILHSGPHGKHLEILAKNNNVCITFCSDRNLRFQHPDMACSYSMESQSVLCRATISFVDDNDLVEKERVLNIFMKNYTDKDFKYSEPALRNVKVWKVNIIEITAKSFGQNFKNHI